MPKVLARKSVDMPILLAAKLEAAARARGVSEARLIREVLGAFLDDIPVPAATPKPPPRLADRWNGTIPTSESIDDQYLLHTQKYDDDDD